MYGVDEPGIGQPLDGQFEVFGACTLAEQAVDEFAVLFGQLGNHRLPHHTDPWHFDGRSVFGEVVFVRVEDEMLDSLNAVEIAAVAVAGHGLRHAAHEVVGAEPFDQLVFDQSHCVESFCLDQLH